ncbi:AI-2E family transporter [Pontibacter sp. SGAir0037]|uniref:AI-2E family transporter n=1 Tax=Pontibacter sp. SGAir0037 TaxID=2571030 RepID=UPI0010CD2065|nr:AI-2E family transporter [Pontibacter sp. SGAir0037]QCR21245.1 hypothetical protein C1N53_02020 [Pontibacter sp. SGAir0037]
MGYSKHRKLNAILITLFAVFAGLYFGASFLEPFAFAAFLATLVVPFTNWLEQKGAGRMVSSLIGTFVVFVVVSGFAVMLSFQLSRFLEDIPEMQEAAVDLLEKVQDYFYGVTGISPSKQTELLRERSDQITGAVQEYLTTFVSNTAFASLKFLLVIIYLFLFLLSRDKFAEVVLMYAPGEEQDKAKKTLDESTKVAYHYLWGRIKVMLALAAMYIITFWAFGTPYAVLLTMFGAIITIIPYIGPLLSGVLPVCLMLVFTDDFNTVLLFAGVVLVVQLIESYVLEPVIIGSEIRLSPLAVIVAVIIGGQVWGMAGMILFVPLLAIFKIISDNVESLHPIGYLLGNKESKENKNGPGIWKKVKHFFQARTSHNSH